MFRVALGCTLVVACSQGTPEPSEVRARLHADLGGVLTVAKAAYDQTDLPGAGALAFAMHAIDTSAAMGFDPDARVAWLTDNVFTDANYLGDGIYRVPPELACMPGDAACVGRIASAQLRVRVERDGDGIAFWPQLDADHDEPLEIVLRAGEVRATLDLDGASHAMIALAVALGDQAPNASLAGRITVDVTTSGAAHGTATVVFELALAIAVADQGAALAGPNALRLTSAAANVLSIDVDGGKQLAAQLALGPTMLHTPGDPDTEIVIGGASATAAWTGGALALTNVSLATTTNKAGALAATTTIDPFGAELAIDATTGRETIAIAPKLDVRTTVDHAVLGDTPPAYDITRVLLDGTVVGTDALLRITAGTLAVTTAPTSFSFSAAAGDCVTNAPSYAPAACY